MSIITVGHGTLPADELGSLLSSADVELVVDVRRYPGSRRHPHVGSDAMRTWLPDHGIGYAHLAALGGRRRATEDATNAAWRNPQFRAYADHMGTAEFRTGVDELRAKAAATAGRVAVLCSESVWWRCHRRLLADHLQVVDGVPVEHLFHNGRLVPHAPTSGHRIDGPRLIYPPG